jgi:hypothetical protein
MGFPTLVRTPAGAEKAPDAPAVACVPADRQIADTLTDRSFSRKLGVARRIALTEPEAAARLLGEWMSHGE